MTRLTSYRGAAPQYGRQINKLNWILKEVRMCHSFAAILKLFLDLPSSGSNWLEVVYKVVVL